MVEANRAFGQAAVRCLPQPRANSRHIRPWRTCKPPLEPRKLRISQPIVDPDRENRPVNLVRSAWLVTVLICLITVLILVIQGYLGYAGVTFAVAVSAAFNLV